MYLKIFLMMNFKLITQKCAKGNSLVIVDRLNYIKKMDNKLSDQKNLAKQIWKIKLHWIFLATKTKHVDKVLKKLTESNIITEKKQEIVNTCR